MVLESQAQASDLLHFPTTSGGHCTGDAIEMGEAIGAKTIDLEWVQVHPTGMVKPDDADAKIKSSQQKRSAELVVLSSKHTETVLPMSWDGGTT